MSAERVPEHRPELRIAGDAGDAIAAWLDLLEKLLRFPSRESGLIREELESHLRERVRDLVVSGTDEDDAVRVAVGELGDAALLAARYRGARAYPRRRFIMNMSMLGLAGVLVAVGAVTFSQPGSGVRVSVFEPPAPSPQAEQAAKKTFAVEISDRTLEDALRRVSELAGLKLSISWRAIEEGGVARESMVTYVDTSTTVDETIRTIAEELAPFEGAHLDYRIDDGVLRVATEAWFDRQETILASYDISTLSADVEHDDLVSVIQNYVHPSSWENNGGDMAKLNIVGQRLFVQAPRRYHAQIEWFLSELKQEELGVTVQDPTRSYPQSSNLAK